MEQTESWSYLDFHLRVKFVCFFLRKHLEGSFSFLLLPVEEGVHCKFLPSLSTNHGSMVISGVGCLVQFWMYCCLREFLSCTRALQSTSVIATAVGIFEFALNEIAENPTVMVTPTSTKLLHAYPEHQEDLCNSCRAMQCCSCIALYIRAY